MGWLWWCVCGEGVGGWLGFQDCCNGLIPLLWPAWCQVNSGGDGGGGGDGKDGNGGGGCGGGDGG